MNTLLSVKGLRIQLPTAAGMVTVVDGVDYEVETGQVFGIAGESGSGKTISVLALLGLLPDGAEVEGSAMFGDVDLVKLGRRSMRGVRGKEIAMVFQDPMTSLHPMLTIERQLTEHVRYHLGLDRAKARARAIGLLDQVRFPDPAGALGAYPHQFSGGMRQRIAIAMALACGPRLLIADEPTTALDVTVQAGILRLLDGLRREFGLSVIMITHDLGVMSSIADWLTVMYAGNVVESGRTSEVLAHPRHPYTAGLLAALPHPEAAEDTPLISIAGAPPSPQSKPAGCAFHPRCRYAIASCTTDLPPLVNAGDGRRLACPVDPLLVPA
jgi:oligopeptide transport system ATP-binding protein